MKYNRYTVVFHNGQYVYNDKEESLEWDESIKYESKTRSGFGSFERAMAYVTALGHQMAGYGLTAVSIKDKCCGEVYQWVPELTKCKCCGNEKWSNIETDNHHTEKQAEYQLVEKS